MEVINSRFGSARGLLRLLGSRVLVRRSEVRALQNVDLSRVERFVFVCRGNVCRSPFCEYVARSMDMEAISFGLECRVASPARERIRHAAQSFGLDLDRHRSTDIKHYRPLASDLVVVTEPEHARKLEGSLGEAQLTLLGLWTRPGRIYIHDPYSANPEYCRRCTQLMYSGVTRLVREIRRAKSQAITRPVALN